MNLDRIRERLHNGFKPFVIELSSGKRLKVPHPEFMAIGRKGLVVMGADDSVTIVDALHIVSVENLRSRRKPRSTRAR
jgi:hypothetical protein